MDNYLVVLADLVGSRSVPARGPLQEWFARGVDELNSRFQSLIVSPLTVTLGDEFQGVLRSAGHLFQLVHQMQLHLWERFPDLDIRFVFGVGGIDTALNRKSAIGMDGPAFHFARETMEKVKSEDLRFGISSEDPEIELLDTLCHWIDINIAQWKHHRIALLYHHRRGSTQVTMEKMLGISQPAISQNITRPDFQAVLRSELTVEKYLSGMLR